MGKQKSQSSEDYLEAIYVLSKQNPVVHRIDVAKRLSVSGAAVNKAVRILLSKGLVYEDGKHLFLTKEGENMAKEVYRRHCVLREFFLSLGVDEQRADEDACAIEHQISDETFQAIEKQMKK